MPEAASVLQVVRPAEGGMRRHVSMLCHELVLKGWRVEVAASPEFTVEGCVIPIHPIPISARPGVLTDLRAALKLASFSIDFDLVHAHGIRAAWIAALASRRTRKPFLFTAHNLAPVNPGRLARTLFRWAARRADGIIAVSHAVAQSLASYGINPGNVTIIPNGIDLSTFDSPRDRATVLSELDIPLDLCIIAAVGRLSPEKGFATLIESAPKVLERFAGACFVLAGEGQEQNKLIALAKERGAEGRFRLVGRYADVPGLLTAADVVVIPSLSEGQGIVALEAMAARKPVVASRVGGLVETIEDGKHGLLVQPGQPDALAEAVLRVLSDEAVRNEMGAAGRKRVEAEYTVEQMVERTVAVYKRIRTQLASFQPVRR